MEFKDRLQELMKEHEIKTAQELADRLEKKNSKWSLHRNTIANYLEGNPPKNFKYYQKLADFFQVSTDYIQGYTNFKTNNVEIKTICNKYGLSEKSLENLERLNRIEKTLNQVNKKGEIDVINQLLSQDFFDEDSKAQSPIITLISCYLLADISSKHLLGIFNNDRLELYERNTKKMKFGDTFVTGDTIIKGILVEIQNEIIKLKESQKKEGEKE